MKLRDKTLLVTGAAKRIGKAICLAAAQEGANLIIHHNHSEALANNLAGEIRHSGREAAVVQADFSDPGQTRDFAEDLFRTFQVDIVINNASLFSGHDLQNTTPESWKAHQDINLTAPFLICQAFAASLPSGKSGRIINLLDWRALRPGPDHLPYTISKAGLAALTRSLAISLAPAITVNGIALGAILPPSDGGDIADLVKALPIPRWAEMQELLDTVLFLLAGPTYITGEIIHLDGGRHLI